MKKIGVFLVGWGVFLLICVKSTSAQEILFEHGLNNNHISAEEIEETGEAKYVFGVLSKGLDTIDYYRIIPSKPTTQLAVELFVPGREEYADFHPRLIISDPLTTRMIGGQAPGNFPENFGGRILNWPEDSVNEVTDKAVFSRMWVGPKKTINLGRDSLLLAIHDPQGGGGRYVIKLGGKTKPFSFNSLWINMLAWVRIKLLIY